MAQSEKRVLVTFFTDAVEDKKETLAQGRPIFRNVDMVRINYPGDRNRELVARADEGYVYDTRLRKMVPRPYREQFPNEWDLYKRGMSEQLVGTPISEIPFITAARREELKRQNVLTAEQYVQLDGAALRNLGMNAREEQAKIKEYIERASQAAPVVELAAMKLQLEEERKRSAEMRAMLDKLVAQQQAAKEPPPAAKKA